MDFFFSPYFPLSALILLMFTFIYFGIMVIIKTRRQSKNILDMNLKQKNTVNKSKIKNVLHELQSVEKHLKSISE
jgi:predicted membrane protein